MEEQIKKLQQTQKFQSFIILFLMLAMASMYFMDDIKSNDIIHTKGLVIEDKKGNPRMIMGFPINQADTRLRTDALSGLLMLDNAGTDRIHLGPHGNLFLGGKYVDRYNKGWSLFFNDEKGEERTGYGYSDSDNSVGLGMDYGGESGGEAIYLYAAPERAFISINADLQENTGIRDRIVLWHDTEEDLSLMKISDASQDGRISLKASKGANPILEWTDSLANKKRILD